jgi:uncharacterized cupredoxin-like copper-binding protein
MQKMTVRTAALILSILLTACGAASPANNASTTLNVDMSEFMFTPSTYTIPAGKEITVKLKNSGAVDHDFIILKKDVEINGSFDHEKHANDMILHAVLKPGESGTFTFSAPTEPGEYQIICGILGHFQAGMIGSLTVVGP